MPTNMLAHGILGVLSMIVLLWLGLVPTDTLLWTIGYLLAWSVLSTLLVASAGAWVAINRARRPVTARRFMARR